MTTISYNDCTMHLEFSDLPALTGASEKQRDFGAARRDGAIAHIVSNIQLTGLTLDGRHALAKLLDAVWASYFDGATKAKDWIEGRYDAATATGLQGWMAVKIAEAGKVEEVIAKHRASKSEPH